MKGNVISIVRIEDLVSKTTSRVVSSMWVYIDDKKYLSFGIYDDIIKFIKKTVTFDAYIGMYKDEEVEILMDITQISYINTIGKESDIKLISGLSENLAVCSVDLSSVKIGEFRHECIVWLYKYECHQSEKSLWFDLYVLDMLGKSYCIKIFSDISNEELIASMLNCYIKCDVRRTQYGLHTNKILLHYDKIILSHEVERAREILLGAVQNDSQLMDYINTTDFINKLTGIIFYEPGYHLVQMATEVILLNGIKNITTLYDISPILRAIVLSRVYLLKKNKDKYSSMILNLNEVMHCNMRTDTKLLMLLDIFSTGDCPEKRLYIMLRKLSKYIIEEKRNLCEDKNISDIINSRTDYEFDWLFGKQ